MKTSQTSRPMRRCCEDSLVHTKSEVQLSGVYLCDPKPKGKEVRGNAIKTTTGLVRVVSDRFMQAGSDPVLVLALICSTNFSHIMKPVNGNIH